MFSRTISTFNLDTQSWTMKSVNLDLASKALRTFPRVLPEESHSFCTIFATSSKIRQQDTNGYTTFHISFKNTNTLFGKTIFPIGDYLSKYDSFFQGIFLPWTFTRDCTSIRNPRVLLFEQTSCILEFLINVLGGKLLKI